jgi:hypothetical protein
VIFLGDFSFVRIFLKNYRVTMRTTLDTSCSEHTMIVVSKARISACMYFLVYLLRLLLHLQCAFVQVIHTNGNVKFKKI